MRLSAIALFLILAPAAIAAPQASLPDIEDEVMCPICGTLLELAESPQAKRQRALVRRLIVEGKSKAEIKDALVAEYGRQVLALPGGSGFDLSAYLVPAIAFAAAAAGLAIGVRRWRRAAGPPRPRRRRLATGGGRVARTLSGSRPTSPATTSDPLVQCWITSPLTDTGRLRGSAGPRQAIVASACPSSALSECSSRSGGPSITTRS